MPFSKLYTEEICCLLRGAHGVAMVFLAPNETRHSYRAAPDLQVEGYRIMPVCVY